MKVNISICDTNFFFGERMIFMNKCLYSSYMCSEISYQIGCSTFNIKKANITSKVYFNTYREKCFNYIPIETKKKRT